MLFRSVLMLAMIASAPALATTADDASKEVRELKQRSVGFEGLVALTFLIVFIDWAGGPTFPILKSFCPPT
jgi:hypothetical protein